MRRHEYMENYVKLVVFGTISVMEEYVLVGQSSS